MNIQRLSPHFTLAEMTATTTGLPNRPDSPVLIANLTAVCVHILEPVREQFCRPVIVHSGFRSALVNCAVGGSDRSQHCKGEAVDFHVAGYAVHDVALWVADHLDFDQLILENFVPNVANSGWVHCSFTKENRRVKLTKFKGSKQYYPGLCPTVPAPAMH